MKRLLRVSVAGSVLAIGACAAQKKSAPEAREPVTATAKKNEAAPAAAQPPEPKTGTGSNTPEGDTSKEPPKLPPPPPVTPNTTTTTSPTAGATKTPGVDVPTAQPTPPPNTPKPGVKPTNPDPGPSNVGVAQSQFDAADKAFVGASGCPAMCKALDSLKNAADHLCALSKSSEPKRCGDAQAKVQKATAKVKSMCGGCGSP